MSVLGNILWIVCGGFLYAVAWALAGLLLCITVIGIPLGVQCFKIAGLVLAPFGKDIDYGGGTGSFLLNLLWIVIFGWELAASAAVLGLVLCVTVVGIPFGVQFFKFARLALMPFGSMVK